VIRGSVDNEVPIKVNNNGKVIWMKFSKKDEQQERK
jgi:hypothetical protein